jgi:hypothetical protein
LICRTIQEEEEEEEEEEECKNTDHEANDCETCYRSSCSMFFALFFLVLIFDPEDGSNNNKYLVVSLRWDSTPRLTD